MTSTVLLMPLLNEGTKCGDQSPSKPWKTEPTKYSAPCQMMSNGPSPPLAASSHRD